MISSKVTTLSASFVDPKIPPASLASNSITNKPASQPDYHVQISYEARKLMSIRSVSSNEQNEFAKIVEKATTTGGYSDPKGFLDSLSSDEVEIIQKVHGLANSIDIESLDHEGAFNLLVMPYDYVDINNDGLLKIGVGSNRIFPPTGSPGNVTEAWEIAKQGINGTEGFKQIISTAPFRAAEIRANLRYDDNGQLIGTYAPSDENYTNIYKQPGFSWPEFVDDCLNDLRLNQTSMTPENFKLTEEFLNRFKDEINSAK